MVRGRVKESMRLSRNVRRSAKPLVIVYHRYKFTDSLQYLSEVCTLLYTEVWYQWGKILTVKFSNIYFHRNLLFETHLKRNFRLKTRF